MSKMGIKARTRAANTAIYIILSVMSVLWLLPVVWLLLSALREESGAYTTYILPKGYTIHNFTRLFTETELFNFPRWYMNTLIVAVLSCTITTFLTLMVAYTYSRLRFKARKKLMNVSLILGMFPGFVTMIVLYKVLSGMGLTGANSVPGLILVYCASSGMGYYVSKGFFDTIPKSLDEAARVDGASRFQVFYKVIMPLSKPIVIYTVLTAFMAPWGDFMFAKYISHNTEVGMNVAVGLQYWISSKTLIATNYTMFCAGGVVVALPVTILFMLLQRYYVEGVTGGAVKG